MLKPSIAALVVGAGLAGCASVPSGDPAQDAALKTFAIAPERAGLYVYRDEVIGAAVPMSVHVDGAPLGRTMARTYLYRELAPGRHTVTSSAENTDTLEMEVEAGRLAYVRQEVRMGLFSARTRLHRVGEAEGRRGVLGSRLAASEVPTQAIEIRVEADDPAWRGPLACEAANSFGRWPFTAPGTVTVEVSNSPLQIRCTSAPGTVAASDAAAPVGGVRQGVAAGAKVGTAAGVALGVAAAPVMGPAFAVMLALGTAFKGAEVGALVGSVAAGNRPHYPSPMLVRIQHAAPVD